MKDYFLQKKKNQKTLPQISCCQAAHTKIEDIIRQPIKSLATLNVGIGQGLSGAKRILPIIDVVNSIGSNKNNLVCSDFLLVKGVT